MRFSTSLSSKIVLLAVTITSVGIRADTIVVPNANTNTSGPGAGSAVPFDPDERWQQIYANQEFNSATGDILRITEIRFRIDEKSLISNFSTVAQGLSIFMGTTTRTFATASPVFAQNSDGELFQALPQTNLPMSGSRTTATSFDVIVPLPNSYDYDRRRGNLLVDIRSVGGASIPFLDIQGGMPEATFAIAGSLKAPSGTINSGGFITAFTFDVVPEPSTVVLLITGLLGLASYRKGLR